MGQVILFAFLAFAVWMIAGDIRRRHGLSGAIWIPTLWAWVTLSKPASTWLGFGGGEDTLEGSPADRALYLTLIVLSVVVLARRNLPWDQWIRDNWPIILFYAFFLVSIAWAYSSLVSLKRLIKDFGNVLVALVVLTEAKPLAALRAVFVRCGLILIPLSLIYIRWFPWLGRRYSRHTGAVEATGVTFQKNTLGILVAICSLVMIWELLERGTANRRRSRLDRLIYVVVLSVGLYLLYLCDSKTSLLCLVVGTLILCSNHLPWLRGRVGSLGVYAALGAAAFFLLENLFSLSAWVLAALGRDPTFTGRTDVWHELLSLGTNSLLGVGFCSFWSDPRFRDRLPEWVDCSAHNGYLEMYIDGGWMGVALIVLLLLSTFVRINRQLSGGSNFALFRFAVFVATVIGNFSESHFGRMSPLWFLFLAIAIEPFRRPARPGRATVRRARGRSGRSLPDDGPVPAEIVPSPSSPVVPIP